LLLSRTSSPVGFSNVTSIQRDLPNSHSIRSRLTAGYGSDFRSKSYQNSPTLSETKI
jgi:hypothetical protein